MIVASGNDRADLVGDTSRGKEVDTCWACGDAEWQNPTDIAVPVGPTTSVVVGSLSLPAVASNFHVASCCLLFPYLSPEHDGFHPQHTNNIIF
ncbi:hypothetical protein Nepgr_031907 [Nepenthes gracilis]|uniref:Uncharacterized protein n=1 Tax=Nepenthes gracilis TaxID=150966 RepID=A0AAD3TJ62_NEPGR|nr:hypothetical protein Nepgr_031907 [Nepenthes gracilis]